MEVHNSRAPALARPLLHRKMGRGEKMWRRVEEGERDWRGESGRRIQLGKKNHKKNGKRGSNSRAWEHIGSKKIKRVI